VAKLEAGTFYQLPKYLHRIVKSPYAFCVLTYLLQCKNGSNACFPSYQTITQGLMSRRQAIKSINELKKAGIISITKQPYKANAFTINVDLLIELTSEYSSLVNTLHQPTSEHSSPPSEYGSLPLVNTVHPNKKQLNKNQEQNNRGNRNGKNRGSVRPVPDASEYLQPDEY
jgi:hypothetical protein